MARRAAVLLAAFILVIGQAGFALAASPPTPTTAPIDKALQKALQAGPARFIVEFAATPDLRGADKIRDHGRRVGFVVDRLKATAKASQAAALATVKGLKGANAKSYWLANRLLVTGDAKLAAKLAKLPGVRALSSTKIYPLVKPVDTAVAVLAAAGNPEWGVDKIGADEVWNEGIIGSGIVVGSVDTGVDFSHPALVNNYRGNNHDGTFTHDYNWWDPSNSCPGEPCDNVGHGTHTMGTMVGGDGPGPFTPDTGVAPGAEWMTAKGCEDFGCTSESLLSSGQFILAPTDLSGNNPDPSRAPDVVNNSWGNDDPGDTFYAATVLAWRAAGIIPVFSAGNAGDACGSAGSPGNMSEVISLGATDESDNIAGFSSRGPSPSGKVSPNLSAPGVAVISSVPGGGYEAFSGTSMAAPHTTGTIALMLSAKAALIGDFDGVLNALNSTAIDRPDDQCGTPDPSDNDPNYVYGEGRIDAKAAVDLVKTGGTLSGTVTDATTTGPIAGARVTANNGDRDFVTTTDASGDYSIFLAAGSYGVTGKAFGYALSINPGVTVVQDQTTDLDMVLTALPRFHVTGHITASEDGSPIEGGHVLALGTPVPPAETNAAGAYDLVLPIGPYTLRASAGGCTEVATAEVTVVDQDLVQDFHLFRKLDDFGHGCRAIPFDWVDASSQSALYGDEFVGRLRLPFDFDFYGATYSQVFLSDNGYVNFAKPDQFNSFPIAIPSPSEPNAAIYPFWQDLAIDATGSIDYATVGTAPNRAFVIEYSNVAVFGASLHVSFEVKLWEDGRIDMLYGNNPANPGDGRNAGIGIENATGTDALQFSFLQGLIDPNTAFRYESVPSGLVHGVVTDANDDSPLGGATVTATPGGRTTTTGSDGTYSLRLRPGAYDLTASAGDYVSETTTLTVSDGSDDVRNFALTAPIGSVTPATIDATVGYGSTTTAHITVGNAGSAPLHWEAKERDRGSEITIPNAASVTGTYAGWKRPVIHGPVPRFGVKATLPPAGLEPIINDPVGDSQGPVDATQIRAGLDGDSLLAMSIDFTPGTPIDQTVGEIYVDVDQNPNTGIPAPFLAGLPTQDVGAEYLIGLFSVHDADPVVYSIDLNTFDIVGFGPANVVGHTINFEIPLEFLGGDDGNMDVDFALGDFFQPFDWAPDVGHGTVVPFTDVAWLSESPAAGTTAEGATSDVTVTLGSPNLAPGTYHGLVVIVADDPKHHLLPVEVNLTVTLPASWGAIAGTVSDAHTGEPLAGASVALHATWNGSPLDLNATTDGDGGYRFAAPSGTWTADYSLTGFVTDSHAVTIAAGSTTTEDVGLHRDQPHATVDPGSFTFVLTPGRTGHGTIDLGNVDGHEPLTFTMDETRIAALNKAPKVRPSGLTSRTILAGHPASKVQGHIAPRDTSEVPPDVLVVIDTLPWESDALLRVLSEDGIAFDTVNSDGIAGLDLSRYVLVILANDQPQAFYDSYAANFAAFEAYVEAGGFLWVSAAAAGSQGSTFNGGVLPGGATVHDPAYDGQNAITDPAHPIVAGMPNPFSGSFASHATFADLPAGTDVIATRSTNDSPTLIEYGLGSGHVLATAQPYDFGFDFGEDTGQILVNGVAYAYDKAITADAPWLTETPTSGTVPVGASQPISVSVDSTGLAPGLYRAAVRIRTNDPDNAKLIIPVTLVVPAYQQGINAGGSAYIDPAQGNLYGADRAFATGGFGYAGASSTKSTAVDIAGTTRDPLYQSYRTGMTAYRFSVPNGTYQVDLSFAELQVGKTGGRVFNVAMEGGTVLSNLDVYALAGKNAALDRTVFVEVTDGVLDITFLAQRGDKPIVNAILVTEMPPGSPG